MTDIDATLQAEDVLGGLREIIVGGPEGDFGVDTTGNAKEETLLLLLAAAGALLAEGGEVTLSAATLAALETITVANPTADPETGLAKEAKQDTLIGKDYATEGTLGGRFAGGKLAKTAQVSAVGDTTLIVPTLGSALEVLWVSAINDPDGPQTPRIRIGFDSEADYLYSGYAIAHWEPFPGVVDDPLICNLDQTGDVAVTVHYREVS